MINVFFCFKKKRVILIFCIFQGEIRVRNERVTVSRKINKAEAESSFKKKIHIYIYIFKKIHWYC